MTLEAVTTPDASGRLDVPPGWRQGRGAFGGLVVAGLMRAVDQRVADPARRIRSVTAELLAPLPVGPATIAVEILRRGNNVTVARAAIADYAHAVCVLAIERKGAGPIAWQDLHPPEAPPWTAVEPVTLGAPMFPEFAQHFEHRLARGLPASGDASEVVGARDPGVRRDAPYIAALVDAYWPAALIRMTAPRPMATLAFTLDLVAGLDGLSPDAPLLYRGTAPVCADGYCLETRELWGEDGRLVAINQQTFVVFDQSL
jgi:acyl-CoA thioesterase